MTVLERLGDDIWIAAGRTVESIGFRYPTRMAVIRLSDGGLFIWSPVALSPELRETANEIGEARFMVTPTSLHHLFLPDWQKAYPHATLYAAPGSRARRKDIAFDEDLGDEAPAVWAGQIDQVVMRGVYELNTIAYPPGSPIAARPDWRGEAKLAGMLCESSMDLAGRIEWLVIGLGANLAHAPEVAGRATASCFIPRTCVPFCLTSAVAAAALPSKR
jgi:hypothetical protein